MGVAVIYQLQTDRVCTSTAIGKTIRPLSSLQRCKSGISHVADETGCTGAYKVATRQQQQLSLVSYMAYVPLHVTRIISYRLWASCWEHNIRPFLRIKS